MVETQKEKLMRVLNCTAEEADDIIKTDKMIDQGLRTPYDLDPETEKQAKKFANSKERKKPVTYDFKKRERKPNETKGAVIAELAQFFQNSTENSYQNVEIANKEREITFEIDGISFSVTLIQHRKK